MKRYTTYLLLLILPFSLLACGGSSGGDNPGSEQVAEPGDSETTPDSESSRQIHTFNSSSNLTPNLAFRNEDTTAIIFGPDPAGTEMPLKSMILQIDDVGSLLVEFSANGMPSALITRDRVVKINKYSYSEGQWFIHFSINEEGSVIEHTVELPQSFGEYVSNLDSWMRSRSEAVNHLSAFSKQDQSDDIKDSIAHMLEIASVGIEMYACAESSARLRHPALILWACQSAIQTLFDFGEDVQLVTPTTIDYVDCLLSFGPEGIHILDAVCLAKTGLRSSAALLRTKTPDTSEMEEIADKSMEQNRFIGEDPVIEDFPMPLLTAPQLAVLSPQWLESFSAEQDVPIKVAASEGIDVVSFEIRSSGTGAVVVSGDTQASFTGDFEIKIESGTLEAGRYLLTVAASNGELSTETYSSFEITSNISSWRGTLRITEETYISGERIGIGKRACQLTFSIISRSEFVPVVYDLTVPKISGESLLRVDSTFGGSNNSRYCTQAPIDIEEDKFTYNAIKPEWDRGDIILPKLDNQFNFEFTNVSNSSAEGVMSARVRVFDTVSGWHSGSCRAEFHLEKIENRGFNACDVSEVNNICQPGSDLCDWSSD